jgi:hypothetical protein
MVNTAAPFGFVRQSRHPAVAQPDIEVAGQLNP